MTAVIAVANQKGGVGKSTTAAGLGGAVARTGKRVTVVDLDPQMTLTHVVIDPEQLADLPTIDDLLDNPEAGLAQAAVPTKWGFDLVPGSDSLAVRERSPQIGDEYLLAQAIEASETQPDVVFIDCPPSLGQLTLMALMAAGHVLLITESTFAALGGTAQFLATIEKISRIKARQHAPLALSGVIVTQVRNTVEQRDHLVELEETFGDRLWQPFVPHTVAAESMFDKGVPAHELTGRAGARRLAMVLDDLATQVCALEGAS